MRDDALMRQYDAEVRFCNRLLSEETNNNNAGATSRSPDVIEAIPPDCHPRAVDPGEVIVIHGDLGLTDELLEANMELERRMNPYRVIEGGIIVFEVEARE